MTAKELAEKLTAIAEAAPVLRAAGVLGRVEVAGEIAFDVCEVITPGAVQQANEPPVHVLDDRETFGGELPRRKRPREEPPPETVEDDE